MREKAVKQALNECEKRIINEQAYRDERRDRSLMPLESTPDRKSASFECELVRESPKRKRRRTPENSVAGDGPPTKEKTTVLHRQSPVENIVNKKAGVGSLKQRRCPI
jgi:hypothetical protein